jgi:hypothetical protein
MVLGCCVVVGLSVSAPLAGQTRAASLAAARQMASVRIQGNALNSTNGALPNQPVRVRDARFGKIVGTQVTDKAGLFSFGALDPGTYIVELIDRNNTVLAASELLMVSAGETVSTVVKLPFRLPPFAGIFGHTVQQAVAITSAAAAAGVLAERVTGVDASAR